MNKIMPIFKIPFPNKLKGGEILKFLLKIGKKFFDRIINGKSSEDMSRKGQFKENNISDVIDYNKLLNNFTDEVKNDVASLENKILDECTQYYTELIDIVETVERNKSMNLHSDFIKRDFDNLKRNISGSLMRSIYSKVSLDNDELKNILRLPSGEMKKNRINNFKEDLMKEAFSNFIDDIKFSVDDFGNYISERLNEVIGDIINNYNILSKELFILESSTDLKNMKCIIEDSKIKLLLADEILKITERK